MRAAHASSYAAAALEAAARGDIAAAFDVFLRGVGGDGYRDVVLRMLREHDEKAAAAAAAG